MKKLLSIVLGIMIFMVPLLVLAATHSEAIASGSNYVHFYIQETDQRKVYVLTSNVSDFEVSVTGLSEFVNSSTPFKGKIQCSAPYTQYYSVLEIPDYGQTNSPLNYQYGPISKTVTEQYGNLSIPKLVILSASVPVMSGSSEIYTPEPDMFAYQLNPGDYARFTKPPGYTAAALDILVSFEAGNNPYLEIKNYNNLGSVNTWNQSPLASFSTVTDNYMDMKLVSTVRNEPITVNTVGIMEKLATGGAPPPDGVARSEIMIDDDPNKVVLHNGTLEAQYITFQRNGFSDTEFTRIVSEGLTGGVWQGVGFSTKIKDYKVYKYKITPGQRMTIYNEGGSPGSGTKLDYPVVEGFNVGMYKDTNPFNDTNLPGDPIAPGDLPGYIDDGVVTVPDVPDDILGFLQWLKDMIFGFFSGVAEVFTGMISLVTQFSTLLSGLNIFPPAFVGLLCAAVALGAFLRVVGR